MNAQPTLAQLKFFVAVADAGSFSEAAAELNVSQSSLSEAVAKLEKILGQPLLRRTTGGTTLTPAGQRAMEHARVALLAISDLHLAVAMNDALSGTLRIATHRSLGVHILAPVLFALNQKHPALQVHVQDSESDGAGGQELIRSGQVDAGFIDAPSGDGLLWWPLLADEYHAVVPASRGAAPLTWAELRTAHLILTPSANTCHRHVQAYLRAHDVQATQLREVEEDGVILKMVEHGLGVTLMPRLAFEPLLPGLRVVALPAPLTRHLGVAVRPGRAGLPHIKAFMQAVRLHLPAPQGAYTPLRPT
ncbi:LysR family transcriptional regulator [Deinococcus peraridilitoris]|uniref:Transcriptional regulator n=1 Tax=Deinococcus peraridilitoris (strain DSM 19664 / LMG 22246 / CIP 109416 / KR-200) TaxID=937777 RepID=L0A1C1_DEIPD|nr:LysR family transcriptional regulator [Deinococcus peraridilitoris]AFZ67688.1 transcriptional regulator [Deinococcus peraridilitoris DSM 19664]